MKLLADGLHLLTCGAVLSVAGGQPASVRYNGTNADTIQEQIEAFTETWIDPLPEIEDRDDEEATIQFDLDQPTHLFTDTKGTRLITLFEHEKEWQGGMVDCFSAMDRYEDWPPFRIEGVWYADGGERIEPQPTLVALAPEAEA